MIEAGPAERTGRGCVRARQPGLVERLDRARRRRGGDRPRGWQSTCRASAKRTRRPGFAYDVDALCGFLEAARVELQIERVHLVVHDPSAARSVCSGGSSTPERWASVVMMNVGVMPAYKWHSLAKRWAHAGGRRAVPRVHPARGLAPGNAEEEQPEGVARRSSSTRCTTTTTRETRRTVLKLYRNTPDPGDTAQELGSALAQLRKPALVIWGASDPFLDVRYAEGQREFFDVQDVAILPESGHWAFQDDPERCARADRPVPGEPARRRASERGELAKQVLLERAQATLLRRDPSSSVQGSAAGH